MTPRNPALSTLPVRSSESVALSPGVDNACGYRSCIYCGNPSRHRRTCPSHRDLEARDPSLQAERAPASEGELGVRPYYRFGVRL